MQRWLTVRQLCIEGSHSTEVKVRLHCLMHLNIPRIKFFSSEGELGTKKVQSSEYFEFKNNYLLLDELGTLQTKWC